MKKYYIFTSVVFVIFLILPTALWAGLSLNTSVYENLTQEIGENRGLHRIAEDVNAGNITAELEAYYTDRVPFRNLIIQCNQKINAFVEKDYTDKIQPYIIKCLYPNTGGTTAMEMYEPVEETQEPQTASSVDTSTVKEIDGKEYAESERVEATCTEEGYVRYVCAETGEEYTEVIPKKAHDEFVLEKKEASYTCYGHTIYQCRTCGKKRWDDFEPKLLDTSFYPSVIYNECVIQGRYNWLFFTGAEVLSYVRGGALLSDKEMQDILAKMEELKALCDEKGIELVLMIMPNKAQVYSEYMPTKHYVPDSTEKRIPRLAQYIRDNSDITFIYPIEELKAGKLYYETYFAYDTHWNNVGAFLGTMALYEALGVDTTKITDVEATPYYDLMEGLFATGNIDSTGYPEDSDVILDYKPEVKVVWQEGKSDIKYGYDEFILVQSEATDTRKFVMFADSFEIAMIPYIEKDFANCTFAQRNDSERAREEIRSADILVISSVERHDTMLYDYIDTVISYLKD